MLSSLHGPIASSSSGTGGSSTRPNRRPGRSPSSTPDPTDEPVPNGRGVRPAGAAALGMAVVPTGVAPADLDPHAALGRGGDGDLQRRLRLHIPPKPGRAIRICPAAYHLQRHRTAGVG